MKYLTLAAGAMALSLCSVVAQAKGPNGVDTGSALDCSVVQRGWKLRECERLAAEQEAAQLAEAEAARLAAEQEAARLAEAEAARLAAEQEAAQLAEAEAARLAAEQEAARLAEAEAARLAAEQEAARLAEAEAARLAAEQEAAQLAEAEAARLAAEQEAAQLAEAEAARLAAEQQAAAQETVLSWSIPTTRQNGELLSPSELAAYEIYITADQSGGEQVIVVNDPMQTSYTIVGLAPDTYHFAISAVDVDGLRSELSVVVDKTIAASVAAL